MAKVYISGKISGIDIEEAKKLFEIAEEEVKVLGGTPINPMKISPYNPDWTWEDYIEKDLGALLLCDGIYMLNNWGTSRGARIEYAVAKEMSIPVIFQK